MAVCPLPALPEFPKALVKLSFLDSTTGLFPALLSFSSFLLATARWLEISSPWVLASLPEFHSVWAIFPIPPPEFSLVSLFSLADGEADAAFFFLLGDVFSFGLGVGVFSLATESTARAFRIGFPSSVVCCPSETKTAMSALNAKKVVNQTRKRNTERSVTECLARSTRDENQKRAHAGNALPGDGSFFTCPSRSRRRIAFNFPPSSKNKQVKYIHVSKMIIDARARYVAS